MAAKRIILLLAFAVLVGGAWFAWRTHADTAEAKHRLADVQDRCEALQRAPNPTAPPRVAREPSVRPNQAASSDSPNKSASPPAPKPPPGMLDLVHVNPQLPDLFVASQRSMMQQSYGVLFRNLHLTPEQQEKF